VSALGNARRSVAALKSRGESLDEWLKSESRLRGIRENAATLAVMEIPEMRDTVALAYGQRYPDRVPALRNWLETWSVHPVRDAGKRGLDTAFTAESRGRR
jgi:hypothetical protein